MVERFDILRNMSVIIKMAKNRNMSRLSKAERQSVVDSGSTSLMACVRKGDDALKVGDYVTEAGEHRYVQEMLRDNRYRNYDDESLDSYSYNSAILHVKPLVEIGQQYGLTFERMFSFRFNENPNYSNKEKKYNYEWRVPEAIISTDGMSVPNMDQKRNSYINEYIDIFEKKRQIDEYNANKYKNILENASDPFSGKQRGGFSETNNSSGMITMDEWLDDYKRRNGLPRSNNNYANGVQRQNYDNRNENANNHVQNVFYGSNSTKNMDGRNDMITMDKWLDDYKRRNNVPQSYGNNSNNYGNTNYLNSLGISRRTWD